MLEQSAKVEGRQICPPPGHRPEKINAEVSGGSVRKQMREAGQGGRQQAVLRPVTETMLMSIENIKNIIFIQTKPCTQRVMAALFIIAKRLEIGKCPQPMNG